MNWLPGVALSALMAACLGCDGRGANERTAREINPDMKDFTQAEEKPDEVELGLPIYPGAKTPKGVPPMMRASVTDPTDNSKIATIDVWLETDDPADEVAEYYDKQMVSATKQKTTMGFTVEGKNRRDEKTRVIATRKPGDKKTKISIIVTRGFATPTRSRSPDSI